MSMLDLMHAVIIILLIVSLFEFSLCAPRTDIVVHGTTVGPGDYPKFIGECEYMLYKI